MLIHRLIFVCLVCLLGIGTANAKLTLRNRLKYGLRCIPISVRVKAEFFERSITKDSRHYKLVESSESFRQNYEKLATSAEISASFSAFSGSAKAAYEGVTDSVVSNKGSRHEEHSKEVTYNPNFLQIQRVVTTEVTIDGKLAKSVEKDYVDSVSIDAHETADELTKRGEKYIRYNFANLARARGANLRGNVYEASACIKEDPVNLFLGKWRVEYKNGGSTYTTVSRISKNKLKDSRGNTYTVTESKDAMRIVWDQRSKPHLDTDRGVLQLDGRITWKRYDKNTIFGRAWRRY